jgi:hypothetical protein
MSQATDKKNVTVTVERVSSRGRKFYFNRRVFTSIVVGSRNRSGSHWNRLQKETGAIEHQLLTKIMSTDNGVLITCINPSSIEIALDSTTWDEMLGKCIDAITESLTEYHFQFKSRGPEPEDLELRA